VFGCAYYSNLSAKTAHKLAPRSNRCIFVGYSADHKGYRCLDLTTKTSSFLDTFLMRQISPSLPGPV
jgi:hypothetical protein